MPSADLSCQNQCLKHKATHYVFNSGSKRSEYFIIFFIIAFSPFVIDRKKMVSVHIKNKKSYEILRTIRISGCIDAESELCAEEELFAVCKLKSMLVKIK